jgi:hypothetical protein
VSLIGPSPSQHNGRVCRYNLILIVWSFEESGAYATLTLHISDASWSAGFVFVVTVYVSLVLYCFQQVAVYVALGLELLAVDT